MMMLISYRYFVLYLRTASANNTLGPHFSMCFALFSIIFLQINRVHQTVTEKKERM